MFRYIYWPLKRLHSVVSEFITWAQWRVPAQRDSQLDCSDAPVFIFAASWRTGSTLLQRVISASNSVFIWGEPRYLDELLALYNRMTEVQKNPASQAGSTYARRAWQPVMVPPREHLIESFRRFFEALYLESIPVNGCQRWGFKEVRHNAVPTAKLLYRLFPRAKFIFLVRNPLDAFLSVKNKPLFANFADPFDPVNGWLENATAFTEVIAEKSLPAILVRYEDLTGDKSIARDTVSKICTHIGIPFSFPMFQELKFTIGASEYECPLTPSEHEKIISQTQEIASLMGYELT